MKSKLVAAEDSAQVHVVVLDSGEEAFATLGRFAGEAGISAASLTAIGTGDRGLVRLRLEELSQDRGQ
jgi:predicted DNA-binding protein with PD1-like motif